MFHFDNNLSGFAGRIEKNTAILKWTVTNSSDIKYFEVERSTDGFRFNSVGKIYPAAESSGSTDFKAIDPIANLQSPNVYYRLKTVGINGKGDYSKVIRLSVGNAQTADFFLSPNPVKDIVALNVTASENQMQVYIYSVNGMLMKTMNSKVHKGTNSIKINGLHEWQSGVYVVKIIVGNEIRTEKMILMH